MNREYEHWKPLSEGYMASSLGRIAAILSGSPDKRDWRYSLMKGGRTYYRARKRLLRSAAPSAEGWTELSEFPGYLINAAGEVARVRVQSDNGNGYRYASSPEGLRGVHRLVCQAFHGPPPFPGAEVAHWDGDKANNRPENLRWTDRTGNMADARRHGTLGNRRKITDAQVIELRRRKAAGERSVVLAAEYGIRPHTVAAIAAGRKRTAVSPTTGVG